MDSEQAKALINQQKSQDDQKKEVERRHRLNLVAMLTPEARERMDRLALVNPAKAEAVGDLIVEQCEKGFVSHRVTDEQMKEFMEVVNSKAKNSGSLTIQRKKYKDSDDDDDDDDDL